MLIEPMIQQLQQLRLRGMAAALEQLLRGAQHQSLSFEERLSVMIQHEITERDSKRLAQRLRWAKLPQHAALEDLDTRTPRGIDPKLISMLTALTWIKDKLNVLITGPCRGWQELHRQRARACGLPLGLLGALLPIAATDRRARSASRASQSLGVPQATR